MVLERKCTDPYTCTLQSTKTRITLHIVGEEIEDKNTIYGRRQIAVQLINGI